MTTQILGKARQPKTWVNEANSKWRNTHDTEWRKNEDSDVWRLHEAVLRQENEQTKQMRNKASDKTTNMDMKQRTWEMRTDDKWPRKQFDKQQELLIS